MTRNWMIIIAWGGIFAQLIVFTLTTVCLAMWGSPESRFLMELSEAFTRTNLLIILLNLIPIQPLDGAEAWKFLNPIWDSIKSKLRAALDERRKRKLSRQMERLNQIAPRKTKLSSTKKRKR